MIKRTMGSALRARTYWSQAREISLRVLTHNIMILWRKQLFDRADLSPLRKNDACLLDGKVVASGSWTKMMPGIFVGEWAT